SMTLAAHSVVFMRCRCPRAQVFRHHANCSPIWASLSSMDTIPSFVGRAVRRVLDETPPSSGRDPVLSHNDVNPGNIVYDGDRLLLVDWDAAGRNDPLYDLAAIAVFLRMDDATCRRLLTAHDGEPVAEVPPFFAYMRRLVAVLCGVMGLQLGIGEGAVPTGD